MAVMTPEGSMTPPPLSPAVVKGGRRCTAHKLPRQYKCVWNLRTEMMIQKGGVQKMEREQRNMGSLYIYLEIVSIKCYVV